MQAGPRMARRAVELLAADDATADDRIAPALPPTADTTQLADRVRQLRSPGATAPRVTVQVHGIGDRVAVMLTRMAGVTAQDLAAHHAAGLLPADPAATADVLAGWSQRLGIDEVVVPGDLADAFTPVLSRLRS